METVSFPRITLYFFIDNIHSICNLYIYTTNIDINWWWLRKGGVVFYFKSVLLLTLNLISLYAAMWAGLCIIMKKCFICYWQLIGWFFIIIEFPDRLLVPDLALFLSCNFSLFWWSMFCLWMVVVVVLLLLCAWWCTGYQKVLILFSIKDVALGNKVLTTSFRTHHS